MTSTEPAGLLPVDLVQYQYLAALQSKPTLYMGTVAPEVVAERRKRNRAARKARRVTRARSG